MYSSSPEEQPSPPDTANSPASSQRTKPGSYGKACDTCRKKKARCNFERPACGYCSAFKHQCSYTAADALATRRNGKKLHIETKRQRPATAPVRKSTGGSFKQPYSADPRSPSGYLTPITPIERGIHSAGGTYHHTRGSDLLGSPLPTSRSVYSPDSTSPTIPASPMNGHGARYQPHEIRPYGQSANGYLQDNRGMLSKINTSQREDTYVAVPLMGEQGKEQTHPNMMDPPTSPHPFQQGIHHQEHIQRVVSPANQTAMSHYQTQSYATYEQYHRNDTEVAQHDSHQQMPQEWTVRRQPTQLPTSDQRGMYRYQEVEGSQTGNYMR